MDPVTPLLACHLGPTPYEDGLRLQAGAVARRAAGELDDLVLYPDHPPLLTVGRSPRSGSIRADAATLRRLGVRVYEVSRGGDVTWHGPGQLVGYVVCGLDGRGRDLHRFLRDLEEALIRAVAAWGVAGERWPGRTGVWVAGEKLASIGVAVRRWVTFHGFALNVRPDLSSFGLIHPCGLTDIQMTSLERLLGPAAPGLDQARARVTAALAEVLGHPAVRWVERPALEERLGAAA